MDRRQFLTHVLTTSGALLGALALPLAVCAAKPGPNWEALRAQLGGRLITVESPLAACARDATSSACATALQNLHNPFFIEDHPGATQTTGWLDAWTAAVSPHAVAAESAHDVVAAVNFARRQGVRLAIKGTGHDYLGRSNAADSLLVWTHPMRDIVMHDAFKPEGSDEPGVPAMSVGAGTRWLEAYATAARHGRYVQGGGCTSVGAAGGFIQGSGFGSFSKYFGTGAGGALEFEIVTADGRILRANDRQNSDLFWALRGGGGGTFGVVTRVTLRTHPMPSLVGSVTGSIKADNDLAFKSLIRQFIDFYRTELNQPHWGEQISFTADNEMVFALTFIELTEARARTIWQPFLDWLATRSTTLHSQLSFRVVPFASLYEASWWAQQDPEHITVDPRKEAGGPIELFWWSSNQGEVSEYLYTYQSRWLPFELFGPRSADALAALLFDASRQWRFTLHINKGLSGASPAALERSRPTAVNPVVFDAAALVIVVAKEPFAFPGIAGHEPDVTRGRAAVASVNACMKLFRDATPKSGAYSNEADYFEPDWKNSLWGEAYPRLLQIKQKYDPHNIFRVHHGIGSD